MYNGKEVTIAAAKVIKEGETSGRKWAIVEMGIFTGTKATPDKITGILAGMWPKPLRKETGEVVELVPGRVLVTVEGKGVKLQVV